MAEVAVTHSIAMVTSLTQIHILLPWLHYRLTYNTQQLFCYSDTHITSLAPLQANL